MKDLDRLAHQATSAGGNRSKFRPKICKSILCNAPTRSKPCNLAPSVRMVGCKAWVARDVQGPNYLPHQPTSVDGKRPEFRAKTCKPILCNAPTRSKPCNAAPIVRMVGCKTWRRGTRKIPTIFLTKRHLLMAKSFNSASKPTSKSCEQ